MPHKKKNHRITKEKGKEDRRNKGIPRQSEKN